MMLEGFGNSKDGPTRAEAKSEDTKQKEGPGLLNHTGDDAMDKQVAR
jgi:hypothetical protein